MNRDNDRQTSIILAVLGILPIVWLGLLIAPSVKGGLPEMHNQKKYGRITAQVIPSKTIIQLPLLNLLPKYFYFL